MTGDGRLVEVQATAEKVPFDRARLDAMLDLAATGIEELALYQHEATMLLAASAPTLSDWEILARLGVAAGLGAAVGFERGPRP
jgi:hypothetical protein